MKTYKLFAQIVAVILFFTCMIYSLPAEAKDTLTYVLGAEPPGLDPANISDTMSANIIMHIYDLPIHTTAQGNRVPGLFTKWEHSKDGRAWTFHLRRGVSFSDGTPFNAEAVKYNWERCTSVEKKVVRHSFFKLWAKNIKIIDNYTIQTTADEPFPMLESMLAGNWSAFLSPAALKKYGDKIMRNPVGTGPFRFVEWVAGERIVLERRDDYWGPKPKLKKIVFKFVKEGGSRVMMLETGEADVILNIAPVEVERLKKNPNINVLVEKTDRVVGLEFNTASSLLNDVRFRRALAHAIDKETIIKHVMRGLAFESCSPITGRTYGAANPSNCIEYNPQKAKALLKEAGYKGEKLKFWTMKGRYPMDTETAETVMSYWNQVEIDVEYRVIDYANLMMERGLPEDKVRFQVLFLGIGTTSGDGDQTLRGQFHSSNIPGFNRSRYRNPEYDQLAMAQASKMNVTKRLEIMKECQEVLARDVPFLPLYNLSQVVGVRSNLKGYEILSTERTLVRDAYFE